MFDVVAVFSLLCYLVFAVVALQYALKPWAEKVMFASIAVGAVASLLLHFALRESPAYVGGGPLWKFVVLSQYVPMGLLIVGGVYGMYWLVKRLKR